MLIQPFSLLNLPRWWPSRGATSTAGACQSLAIFLLAEPLGLLCLRREAMQEDGDQRCDVLLVGEAVGSQRREEQLAAELRQEHPDKGAGAGAHVVRPEAAQHDLGREIGLDEVEDLCRQRN